MSYINGNPWYNTPLGSKTSSSITSPVNSSFVEVNESLLQNRRIKLALQYPSKLEDYLSNPTYDCSLSPQMKMYMKNRKTKFNYVQCSIRIKSDMKYCRTNFDEVELARQYMVKS